MPAPRERLIRKLSRMQAFGEKALFLVEDRASRRAAERHIVRAWDGRRETTEIPSGAGDGSSRNAGGVALGRSDRDEASVEGRWRELERTVSACRLCRLCEGRTQTVFGSGVRRTRLFIVGEGPGAHEDRRGEAFVGPAGQLLTKVLSAIGFGRDQVFITNIVKCRPPGNRAPLPDEVAACAAYLEAQLELVRPVVILALGGPATQALLGMNVAISRVRGRVHLHRGIPLVPTYHPAALLRNPAYKRPTWEDVQLLRRVYDEEMAKSGDGA